MNSKTLKLDIPCNVVDIILDMQPLWIPRAIATGKLHEYPFFTMGRCAYIDGNTDIYYNDSARLNVILLKKLNFFYENVLDGLSFLLGEPVKLAHDLAIPGFHIFQSDPAFLATSGGWHKDCPHTTLELGGTDPHSFTLPIQLPSSGAGLDYIDDLQQKKYFAYEKNNLMVIDVSLIHRISRLREYLPGEYRITLQGHLIRRGKTLEAFF